MNIGSAFISMMADLNPMRRSFKEAKGDVDSFVAGAERGAGGISKAFSGVREMLKGVFQGAGMAAFSAAMAGIGKITGSVSDALFGLNNAAEQAQAKINAFTKDSKVTADILAQVRAEASKTPFAFQEMANATAALQPVAKASGVAWMDLLHNAEILAASNPLEGLEGASFSLREAMTGDFTSIIERFNLSRTTINKLKEEGVPNLEIVRRAMEEMGFDQGLVANMAETMEGKWSTLLDTMDGFKIALTKPTFDFLKVVLGDTQGFLDGNTERWTALATAAGEKFAAGLSVAYTAIKRSLDLLTMLRDVMEGTHTSSQKLGKADWADRLAGKVGEVRSAVLLAIGSFDQLRDSLTKGDFHGGGAFAEDSPLVVGLLRINELAGSVKERLGGLGDKASAGAAKAGITLPTADQLGLAGGVGAGALGAVALLPTLAPMLSPLLSILPAIGTAIGLVISPLGLLAAAVGILAVAWTQNWFDIQGKTAEAGAFVSDYVTGTILPALSQFGDYLKTTVGPAATEAWDSISNAVASGWGKVQPLLDRFTGYLSGDLGPKLAALGATVGPALASMADTASSAFQAILPYVQMFVSAVLNLGATLVPILATVGNTILDSIGPAIGAVVGWATETIPLIASAFKGVMSVVVPVVQTIFSIVTSVLGAAAAFISEHADTITSVLLGAWNIIKGGVQVAWSLLSGIVTTGLKLLSGDWSGAWQSIKDTLSNVWDGIKTIGQGGVDVLKGLVTLGIESIKTVWGNAWDWVGTKLSEATNAIKTTVENWSNGLVTKLDSAAASIKSAILSPFEGARDAIGGIVEAFASKMKGPLQGGLNAMGSFGKGIAGVMRWIAGALKISVEIGDPVVPQLAKGTRNWGGGWAWVGEGPGGAGAELAYLPRGAMVVPHRESIGMAASLGIPKPTTGAGPIPGFAFGLNFPGLLDIVKGGPDWLMNKALEALGITSGPELPPILGNAAGAVLGQVKGWIGTWVADFIKKALPVSQGQIADMLNFAESQVGLPYIWGGGHGGAGGPGVGWDCSGFVAAVLRAGGIPNPGGIVTDFYNWMSKNGGNGVVDIGVNNPFAVPDVQHIGIKLMGKQFESGGPFGGVGVNGTNFAEWGTPPGWEKAAGGLSETALRKIDLNRSLRNMANGVKGQWNSGLIAMAGGGVTNEPILGIGQDSGIAYLIGEAGKEFVIPADVMPRVIEYFMEALTTGNISNSKLVGIPLEMRDALMRIAADGLVEARTRHANQANGGMTGLGGPLVTGRGGPVKPLDPQTDAANPYVRGGVNRPLVYQTDPTPTPAAAGIAPDSGGKTAGTGGGDRKVMVSLSVTDTFNMPDGSVIVRTILTEPTALDDLTEGVTEVQAREIERRTTGGGTATAPPAVAERGPKPTLMN